METSEQFRGWSVRAIPSKVKFSYQCRTEEGRFPSSKLNMKKINFFKSLILIEIKLK